MRNPDYIQQRLLLLKKHPWHKRYTDLSYTQKSLAAVAGVSPQYVMRTLQGLYATPSVKLVEALLGEASGEGRKLTSAVLLQENTNYIKYIRAFFSEEIKVGCARLVHNDRPKVHKHKFFAPSVAGMSRMMAVQISIIQRWGFSGDMPPILEEALTDAGVDYGTIRRINRALR